MRVILYPTPPLHWCVSKDKEEEEQWLYILPPPPSLLVCVKREITSKLNFLSDPPSVFSHLAVDEFSLQ